MVCTHPVRVKVLSSDTYHMEHPEDHRKYHYQDVPCNMCIACRIKKTQEWAYRLLWERKAWNEACFITLTYDEEHLPVTPCGHMTLKPEDPQKFFKRVRIDLQRSNKDASPPLLRYFMCAEYGDEFRRPH